MDAKATDTINDHYEKTVDGHVDCCHGDDLGFLPQNENVAMEACVADIDKDIDLNQREDNNYEDRGDYVSAFESSYKKQQ